MADGSLRFHERMSGFVSFDERSYNQAVNQGKRLGNDCSQSLEIEIDDLDRFLRDPDHVARVDGFVRCAQLGGDLTVAPGSSLNLFVDEGGKRHKRMLYRLMLSGRDGRELTLSGFKDLEDDPISMSGATPRDCSCASSRVISKPIRRETSKPSQPGSSTSRVWACCGCSRRSGAATDRELRSGSTSSSFASSTGFMSGPTRP